MKKIIFLVSLVIATLSSCKDNVTNNNNTAQYVGYWNYTTKGTLTLTTTNEQSILPIDVSGIAQFRQDSDYINPDNGQVETGTKDPNKIDITPDIFTTVTNYNVYNYGNKTSISLSGATIAGTRKDDFHNGAAFNSTYTSTKSGNKITIVTNFSNPSYNPPKNGVVVNYSGSETTELTKVN